jgi:3-oxoacyl-[acyl-carrier-protein] synthase-1
VSPSPELAITALGALSPIGHTADHTASAQRAGIARFTSLPYAAPVNAISFDGDVYGSTIRGYTEGFELFGRWLRIAEGCIRDLRRAVEVRDPAFWAETSLVACLPAYDDKRMLWSEAEHEPLVRSRFIDPLALLTGLSAAHVTLHFGHCSTARALGTCATEFSSTRRRRALVVAVDSLVDESGLRWLDEARRLKPANPLGVVPGEAGACLLVESVDACRSRSATMLAKFRSFDASAAPRAIDPAEIGRDWARRLHGTGLLPTDAGAPIDVYVDLNGEAWRAQTWGHALHHLCATADFDAVRQIHPATSLGEIGAASAAIAVCLAARSFERGYAHGKSALVASLDERGASACIALERC